jgi:hypothetical protein
MGPLRKARLDYKVIPFQSVYLACVIEARELMTKRQDLYFAATLATGTIRSAPTKKDCMGRGSFMKLQSTNSK